MGDSEHLERLFQLKQLLKCVNLTGNFLIERESDKSKVPELVLQQIKVFLDTVLQSCLEDSVSNIFNNEMRC